MATKTSKTTEDGSNGRRVTSYRIELAVVGKWLPASSYE